MYYVLKMLKVALCANSEKKMVYEKLKFEITVYFVTSVHRSILNLFQQNCSIKI